MNRVHTSAFSPKNTGAKFALEHTKGWLRPPAPIAPPAQTCLGLDSARWQWGGKSPPQRERLGAATLLPSSSSSLGAAATPPLPGWGWEAHDPALVHGSSRFLKHSKIWPEPLFYSTPPSAAGRRPNCVFIYFCIFPAPRTHWRGVGGSRGRLPRRTQKNQGGAAPPVPPGQEEAGKRGAGSRKGGTPTASPTPFALCARLGKLKIAASIEWLQAPQRAC